MLVNFLNVQCDAVFHVRRADVTLHGSAMRRYHAIEEYVNASGLTSHQQKPNVFLLTDDQNAIDEAEVLFPDINWIYLDRKRHKGSSGGWENQIPSDSVRKYAIPTLTKK
eukprot:CAMPEP_0178734522 /NCGR_PEP_ID=MMETSP0744-20121128/1388_1 /TAXON_ID=913974 /ORGANISM="Nitzschia punctata, Strain CCMP561" /LENGTH=109 /DNA_ID=CAMNT_0020386807 /DNA_START=58 /DNA_END=387 /DNA_ORIENTATION=-